MQDCSSGKFINSLFFLLKIYGFKFLVTSSRCQAKSKFLLILLSSNKMKEDVFLPTTLPTNINKEGYMFFDSKEHFEAFEAKLRPILSEMEMEPGELEVIEIYNIIRRNR